MACWRVWRKGQVIAGIALLMALTAGLTAAACGAFAGTAEEKKDGTPTSGALAVFAPVGDFFAVEETPSPSATETNEVDNDTDKHEENANTVENDTESTAFNGLKVEIIRPTASPEAPTKSILIYHTHTYEAYAQETDAPYAETEKWRTRDTTRNVVAVGNALAATLRALGYNVVHDFTAFEPPDLDGAYARSLAMLEKRKADGEDYDLYIDLHRDAYAADANIRQTVNVGGTELARVLVLVGKGTNYAEKPNTEANRALGEKLSAALNAEAEGLCRGVSVKSGRYNQHTADHCLLLECGNNRNALGEVTAMVPYLAQAIDTALRDE